MTHQEWPAEAYAVGSYIQRTVADHYLAQFNPNPSNHILDIGCGEGAYSLRILEKIPEGTLLGIDASANMITMAQKKTKENPRFSVKQMDVLSMTFKERFDNVVSFWCLQWCPQLEKAFRAIWHALKTDGRGMMLLPAGDDPFIAGFHAIKNQDTFSCLRSFIPPVDYNEVRKLPMFLQSIPFANATVTLKAHTLYLSSLNVFHRFLNGLAFFQGQVSKKEQDLLNEAIVQWYEHTAQRNEQGQYRFDFSVYIVDLIK